MNRLPHEPEIPETMVERFPKAVEDMYVISEIASGLCPPPSGLRKHVFDWQDGARLIVSIDIMGVGEPFAAVHVSASFQPDSALSQAIKSGAVTFAAFVETVVPDKFTTLTQRMGMPSEFGLAIITERWIPHFLAVVPAQWPVSARLQQVLDDLRAARA